MFTYSSGGIMRRRSCAACVTLAVVAAGLAGCSSSHVTRSAAHKTTLPSGLPSAASPAPSPTGKASDAAVNLPATNALRLALRQAYVSARPGVRPDEVDGPRRGTLYYAFVPATRTYWAIAWFDPSAHARYQTQVNFQDGMGGAVFTRHSGGNWRATVHERGNLPCPGDVPPSVLRAWALKAQSCTI